MCTPYGVQIPNNQWQQACCYAWTSSSQLGRRHFKLHTYLSRGKKQKLRSAGLLVTVKDAGVGTNDVWSLVGRH